MKGTNVFLRGCLGHRDQLFRLFELKKLFWPYRVTVTKEIFDGD